MKLRRVLEPPSQPGATGFSYYETADGRFKIKRIHIGGRTRWQARALDGSEPFRFGARFAAVYNGDSLQECRKALETIYEGLS